MSRNTDTTDRYLFAQNIAELQKQAGVEREVAELVVAYGRLRADSRKPVEFYPTTDSSVPWNFALQKLIDRNPEIDPRAQQFFVAYNCAMHSRRLPTIYSKEHLAARLGATIKQLDWLAYGTERYRTFSIPKANGEPRRVDEPVEKLKSVQRSILHDILDKLRMARTVHGFRRRRSILTNARKHLLRQVVVRIDVEDFFPTLTFRQARRVFLKAGYPFTVANLLANLCSRDGVLPIGAPTSPALANQICRKLDKRLRLLGRDAEFRYSRYADDLVFSSSNRKFASLVPFLKQIIVQEGFRINERKLAIIRRNSRQVVTGIVVNRRTNVARDQFKWIRAVVHNCRKNGADGELQKWRDRMAKAGREAPDDIGAFERQLAGRIAFIRHVHPERGQKLWDEFRQIEFA
jgi:retron-type reverse transcriptase